MDAAVFFKYLGVFIALVAAGVGFPIPEEVPVFTGGALVGHPDNNLRWWIMLPVCIAGVVISDGLLYGIGRLWGPHVLEIRWVKTRLLPPDRREHIENNFREYGVKILLTARFLPAIRSPIFITAGIMRVPFSHFLLADGLYAIPGVSLLFFLGFWLTDQYLEVVHRLETYRPLVVVVILVAVASYLVYHFFNQPMVTGDPKELPVIMDQVAAKIAGPAHSSAEVSPTHGKNSDGSAASTNAESTPRSPPTVPHSGRK